MSNPIILSGLKIYTEHGLETSAGIMLKDGILHNIFAATELGKFEHMPEMEKYHFPENYHLLPGFIDLHIHGADGSDVMDANMAALSTISLALAREGTTGFLATTMTATNTNMDSALSAIAEYRRTLNQKNIGAEVLGVHLEGPFLSQQRMGAQAEDFAQLPNIELIKHWQILAEDSIKLITLAPELANSAELIAYLLQQKIIVAQGHSNANYAETQAAISAGVSYATHLFNAMPSIHHREPGAVTALLLAEQVSTELIVDGVHLHPAIVQLALKIKGKEKVILVTDAMRAKCLSDGCYDLGGQNVYVNQAEARLANGTLAGSVLPMIKGLQNIMQYTQCSLADAILMVSTNPAKILNLQHKKGSIAVGKDADLVVLDENYAVVMTIRAGRIVYSS